MDSTQKDCDSMLRAADPDRATQLAHALGRTINAARPNTRATLMMALSICFVGACDDATMERETEAAIEMIRRTVRNHLGKLKG